MADNRPMVTVLMPVYNGERYLRYAVDSILNQTFKDLEFLIIDDGSTDTSREIIRSYADPRIRLIENVKNQGLIKTLNRGLELAQGTYIARQDQDDVSHLQRLEKQVNFFTAHPGVVLAGTQVNSMDQYGRTSRPFGCCVLKSEIAIRWQSMFDNPFVHSSVMMRTDVVRREGGYDEHFVACEDFEFFSRLTYTYQTSNLSEVLLDYRYHADSITSHCTKEHNLLIGEILQRTLARYLKGAVPPQWVKTWLAVNNPHNFSFVPSGNDIAQGIRSFHRCFAEKYPDAHSNVEIRSHIARIGIRIAYHLSAKSRKESLSCFMLGARHDLWLACVLLPRYLGALALGSHRGMIAKKLAECRNAVCALKERVTKKTYSL